MKRILLLTDGWRRFVTTAWSTGILQYIREIGGGYSLSEYHCWGNWSHDDSFNAGEYLVFTLPNLSEYDGIIVDLTNITNKRVRNQITSRVVKSGVPAISLCDYQKGLHCVRVDNYAAICQLFDHLWEKHGCRTFHFVGSSQQDSESAEREKAFIDCLKKHGIEPSPDMFTEGDYGPQTGALAAGKFFGTSVAGSNAPANQSSAGQKLSAKEPSAAGNPPADAPISQSSDPGKDTLATPLPDAFICANDNIAVGLAMEMRKYGYECPRDYKMTGFDNLDKAMYYQPQITTVSLEREHIAYEAAKWLCRMMNGEQVGESLHVPMDCVFTESCGCENAGRVDYRGYLSWQVEDSIFMDDRQVATAAFSMELDASLPIEELLRRVMTKYASFDLDGVYIVADDRIREGKLENLRYNWSHLRVSIACERGENGMRLVEFSDVGDLFRHLDKITDGNSTVTFPLHIGSLTAGFLILLNPRFMVTDWRCYEFQDIVLRALTEWEANRKLTASINKLQEVYNRDLLTGMYSKSAFNTKFLPWFSGHMENGDNVAVLFIDVDHFKQINDNHGHAYGDHILQMTAEVIQNATAEDGFCFATAETSLSRPFRSWTKNSPMKSACASRAD